MRRGGGDFMMTWLWPALISSASGLAGVSLGAALAARIQHQQWTRGKQVEACAAVVVESTRVQLALRRWWKRGDPVDWVAWNEALAQISLVSDPAVVEAAGVVDEVFWKQSERIERGEVADEAQWFATTSRMEAARLAFVNIAKGHVLGSRHRLDQLPIRRPDGYMPGTVDQGELPATS